MIVLLREAGLRIVIYVDDHPPPHVHVLGDGEAKVWLVGPDGRPRVMDAGTMRFGDLRKALRAISDAQAMLLDEWTKIHG